jgi:polar amino acid transport system substrate-binding protein
MGVLLLGLLPELWVQSDVSAAGPPDQSRAPNSQDSPDNTPDKINLGNDQKVALAPLLTQLEAARAKGLEPVKMGYIQFPPFSYTDKAGKPAGVFIDLAYELMAEYGLSYQFVEYPVARLYQEMKMGGTHLWLGTPGAPLMEGTTIVGSKPFGHIRLNIYGLPGDKPPSLDKLANTRLITLQGYVYGGLITKIKQLPGVTRVATPDHLAAFSMLITGRAPYLLDFHMPGELSMAQLGITDVEITPVYNRPSFVIVSKKAPFPELLLDLMDTGVERIYTRRKNKAISTAKSQ